VAPLIVFGQIHVWPTHRPQEGVMMGHLVLEAQDPPLRLDVGVIDPVMPSKRSPENHGKAEEAYPVLGNVFHIPVLDFPAAQNMALICLSLNLLTKHPSVSMESQLQHPTIIELSGKSVVEPSPSVSILQEHSPALKKNVVLKHLIGYLFCSLFI